MITINNFLASNSHYFKLESQKEIEINELEDGGGRVGGGERVEEVRRINEAWNEAIMQKRWVQLACAHIIFNQLYNQVDLSHHSTYHATNS